MPGRRFWELCGQKLLPRSLVSGGILRNLKNSMSPDSAGKSCCEARAGTLSPLIGTGRAHAELKNSRIPDDARKKVLGAMRTETSSTVIGIGRDSAELKIRKEIKR